MMNGLPSGQTMAARRIDDRHSTTVVKYQGKLFATSNAELSADGKVMKVGNDVIVGTPGRRSASASTTGSLWVGRAFFPNTRDSYKSTFIHRNSA